MKKSKFSEEQIGRILKEVEAGAKVAETCRKHGISEPTYYALYESLGHPLTILSTLPAAGAGALLAMLVAQT